MSSYTKSPKQVLQVAHLMGLKAFPLYWHEYSPRTYTQPQLFACLVLKTFLGLDYRRFHGLLEDCPDLVKSSGMDRVPHFTKQYPLILPAPYRQTDQQTALRVLAAEDEDLLQKPRED